MSGGATVLAEPPRCLAGDPQSPAGGWLIVADMPPGLDGRHGEPFADEAGQLLQNMLRALSLAAGTLPVHLMRVHRGVASGQPGSPAALGDVFDAALAALAPRVVLAMGPLAAQGLLQSGEPLGKLRGRPWPLPLAAAAAETGAADATGTADTPAPPALIATYHPAYLMRNPADKGRAWADLCLAAETAEPAEPAAGPA